MKTRLRELIGEPDSNNDSGEGYSGISFYTCSLIIHRLLFTASDCNTHGAGRVNPLWLPTGRHSAPRSSRGQALPLYPVIPAQAGIHESKS